MRLYHHTKKGMAEVIAEQGFRDPPQGSPATPYPVGVVLSDAPCVHSGGELVAVDIPAENAGPYEIALIHEEGPRVWIIPVATL